MKQYIDLLTLMKELPAIRFYALWLIGLLLGLAPVLLAVANIIEALNK